MSYCCAVNLSRDNYFLANKNLSFYRCLFVYIIKRTLHGGLKIWILFSSGKTIFYERAQRVSKILFLPLEDKIHIFAPPCNILYILLFSCTSARVHFSPVIVQLVKKLGSTINFFFVGSFVPIWKEHVAEFFLQYKFAIWNYMADYKPWHKKHFFLIFCVVP